MVGDDRLDTFAFTSRGVSHKRRMNHLVPLMHRCAAGPGLIIDYFDI